MALTYMQLAVIVLGSLIIFPFAGRILKYLFEHLTTLAFLIVFAVLYYVVFVG